MNSGDLVEYLVNEELVWFIARISGY